MASKAKKIVIGCSIGCGGLILLGVILMISFASWIGRPGEMLEPVRLLGEDTAGYAEWTLRLEDPGTEQFVEGLLSRNSVEGRRQRGEDIRTPLPPELEEMLFNWQGKRDREEMRKIFPVVGAWTMTRRTETGPEQHLFTVSLKSMGNRMVFADWMLGWAFYFSDSEEELARVPYKDEVLYQINAPEDEIEIVFFLRGNDVFFCYDLDVARRAVDRLTADAGSVNASPLDQLFAGIDEGRAIRGAVANDHGEVFHLWNRIAARVEDPETLESIASELRGATLQGGLADEDTLAGRVSLLAPDAEWAAEHGDTALAAFRDGFALDKVEFAADGEVDGEWIRIDFRISGLAGFLDSWGEIGRGGVIVIDPDKDD